MVFFKDVVRVLLDSGADVTLLNSEGQTPRLCSKTKEISELIVGKTFHLVIKSQKIKFINKDTLRYRGILGTLYIVFICINVKVFT